MTYYPVITPKFIVLTTKYLVIEILYDILPFYLASRYND